MDSSFLGTWNETLPESDSACTTGNSTYVYPCCEAMGIEARFDCQRTVCHIGPDKSYQWFQCISTLAAQLGQSKPPTSDCQPAKMINANLERKKAKEAPKSQAARQMPIGSLAIVMFLAAAAVVA